MKVLAGMVVGGHEMYHDCAKISIASFLKSNKTTDLVLFTDKPENYSDEYLKNDRFNVISYKSYCDLHPTEINFFINKVKPELVDRPYCGYIHNQVYATVLFPMLHIYAEVHKDKYDWLQRIDADSYFVGDIYERLEEEIGDWMHMKDFFLVERIHSKMAWFDKSGVPGAGFVLWKRDSRFYERFKLHYRGNEQEAIWGLMKDGRVLRHTRLLWPGYHMVYPFRKNIKFTKEEADEFIPAYFHLGGNNLAEQMTIMDNWYNCKSGVNNE